MKFNITFIIILIISSLASAQNCKTSKHFRNDVLIESIHYDMNGKVVMVESYDRLAPTKLNSLFYHQYDSLGMEVRVFSATRGLEDINIITKVRMADTIYTISTSYFPFGGELKSLQEYIASNNFNDLTTEVVGQSKTIKSSIVLDSTGKLVLEERDHINKSISSITYYKYNDSGVLVTNQRISFTDDLKYLYEVNESGKITKMLQVYEGDTTVRFEKEYDEIGNLVREKEYFSEKVYRYQYCPSMNKYVVDQIETYWNEKTREKSSTQKFEYNEFCLEEKWELENHKNKSKMTDRYEYIYYD